MLTGQGLSETIVQCHKALLQIYKMRIQKTRAFCIFILEKDILRLYPLFMQCLQKFTISKAHTLNHYYKKIVGNFTLVGSVGKTLVVVKKDSTRVVRSK